MVNEGDKAPNFCLKDQDENEKCLKDYSGRWLVLYFYPKDNTPGCTTEANEFSGLSGVFNKLNADIVGISPDSVKSHQKFIIKLNLDLTLLSDPEHEALEKYEAWKLKKSYGKESMGVVRSTFLIDPRGKIRHMWPRVKVEGHVQDVYNKLRELQKD